MVDNPPLGINKRLNINNPPSTAAQLGWPLSITGKALKFLTDKDGNPLAIISVGIDLEGVEPINPIQPVKLYDSTGNTAVGVATFNPTNVLGTSSPLVEAASVNFLGNITNNNFEALRTPNIFKTKAATTVAATAVWTPTSGKKFRMLGGIVTVGGIMAAAGVETISLQDSTTEFLRFSCELGSAAAIESVTIPIHFPGNGYLSSAANNVLNCVLGTAISAGEVSINAWGTEE